MTYTISYKFLDKGDWKRYYKPLTREEYRAVKEGKARKPAQYSTLDDARLTAYKLAQDLNVCRIERVIREYVTEPIEYVRMDGNGNIVTRRAKGQRTNEAGIPVRALKI